MRIRKMVDQNKETTGWSVVGLILGLMSSSDLLVQVIVAILVPIVSWTLLYFWKREISHRFPLKEPKSLPKDDESTLN